MSDDPIGGIIDAATDAANTVMAGVEHVSPLIDHMYEPWEVFSTGYFTIPGTNLTVSLSYFLLGPLIGLPFIEFRRRGDDGNSSSSGLISTDNSYYADLKIFVNDVAQEKKAFITPDGFPSSIEVTNYFKENASFNYIDICVLYPNSTITLIFNDSNFSNNDGAINVSICYLGENTSCTCSNSSQDDTNSISVGFTTVDPNLSYPVSCHGMTYVGDKENGISTGGRCEKSTLNSAEEQLNLKYFNKYSANFDDTETEYDLEKSRVLDLVYKFNGSSWVRQQNLIESVYYHSGVGTVDHSIFFGGIHETMANYSFSYNNDIINLEVPNYEDFNFDNKHIYAILEDKLYGQVYPNTLSSSQCWVEPAWKFNTNFNTTPERVNNPTYTPTTSAEYLGFIRDQDFPPVSFISVEPNGSFDFGASAYMVRNTDSCNWVNIGGIFHGLGSSICTTTNVNELVSIPEVISGSNHIKFTYPTMDTVTMSANLASATKNSFIVKVGTTTISGTDVLFKGGVQIKDIYLEYPHKVSIYPKDVQLGSISNQKSYFALKSINSNAENINLVGAFQDSFTYTSTNGGTSGYNNRALFTLRFNSLNDIRDGILNRTPVIAEQNFTVLDSCVFPVSAMYVYGTGQVLFDIVDRNGVMIGVENKNYIWNDSLENSNFKISEKLNINAKIGNTTIERWGTPLWSAAFTNSTEYTGNYVFNSRIDTINRNEGNILHEITSLVLESNSLMALANNRIFVTGTTQAQDHNYKALNNITLKGNWKINSISYEPNSLGDLYTQINRLSSDGSCVQTYSPSSAITNISGSMISQGAVCCSGIHNFPSNLFLTYADSVPISSSDGNWYMNLKYNYIDGCAWQIYSVKYTPTDLSQTNNLTYSTNCIYSCPNTTVESLLTGSVTSSGKQFNFPSDNFVVTSTSSSVASGGTYVKNVTYDFLDDTFWKINNIEFIEYIPLIGCSLNVTSTLVDNKHGAYTHTSNPITAISVSGVVSAFGSPCCSGDNIFPTDFESPTMSTMMSGSDIYSIVEYQLKNGCTTAAQGFVRVTLSAKHNGKIYTTLKACPVGELDINIKSCEVICEKTKTHINSANIDIQSAGTAYAEYSTNFIQEYRDDSRYKVPEYWVTSNANNNITPNKGITVSSKWKRYMDGVGLGGDSPDYDTIYNTKAKQSYDLNNWKEIGTWNVGQMAFGTPDKAIVVGGHKVSRNVGNSLIGSGLHANDTSKRVYIWNVSDIAEEDSYLKNYYGRRFNTYYSTSTMPISSNQNQSDLSIIIYDAASDIVVERFGSVTFDGSKNSVDVKFDKILPEEIGVKYSITMTCSDNVKVWWENKTTSGFTVKSEIDTWSGTVDYIATAITTVTEKDITENPTNNGYIFEK